MKIGNFTKTEDGRFVGHIQTLSAERDVQFVPEPENDNENAPDYRILSIDESVEYGAAWLEKSKADNPYLSCQLDDPLASTKLYGALTREGDGYNLFWSRNKPKTAKKKSDSKETL